MRRRTTWALLAGSAGFLALLHAQDNPPAPSGGKGLAIEEAAAARGGILNHEILIRAITPDGIVVQPVDDHRDFRSGERFKLAVRPQRDGYLYVLTKGSMGETKVLFPYRNSAANFLPADRRAVVPGEDWYRFDNDPGEETLFLVFSPKRVDDLEQAVRRGGEIDDSAWAMYRVSPQGVGVERGSDRNGQVYVKRLTLSHTGS